MMLRKHWILRVTAWIVLFTLLTGCALADVYSDAGFIKKIPMKPKYTEDVEHHGSVVTLNYTTHAYALEAMAAGDYEICEAANGETTLPEIPEGVLPAAGEDILVEKTLYIYLPYGYDGQEDYNVLYLMHGGGEDESYWLGENRMGKSTCKVLDRMVEKGEMAKTIIVCPTFYSFEGEPMDYTFASSAWPMYFWMELRNEVIPLVETTYATYAHADVSEENLIATREHRAFAGFSMGSATSLNSAMKHCLDILAYVGSFSGSLTDPESFEKALLDDKLQDMPVLFWYNGSGNADMAHDEHAAFYARILEDMPERFTDGENCCWVEFKGGTHAYNCWLPHLYNCLRLFFMTGIEADN